MNKRLLLTLTTVVAPGSLMALGIRSPGQDPYAMSRANAFVATADNPSAIYYNPAGITQLSGQNVSLGANIVGVNDQYTSPGGQEIDNESQVHVLPQLYYTYSMKEQPLSFGLGIYSPFGLGMEWPDQTPFRQLSIEGEMAFATINPVVSWKIKDGLSIGAGAMINYADTTLKRGILPPGVGAAGNNIEFDGDGWSAGFNVGVLWQITERHSVGVAYRSESRINLEGTTYASLPVPNTQNSSADFQFPQFVTFGYSFRPTPQWNIELNFDWTDWDSLNTVTLQQPSGNLPLVFNWESSWMMSLGGTYKFGKDWSVSAGYTFSENSVPEATFTPGIPDSNRHIFNTGFTKKIDRILMALALQYAYGPERTINNGTPANGSYVFNSLSVSASIGYQF